MKASCLGLFLPLGSRAHVHTFSTYHQYAALPLEMRAQARRRFHHEDETRMLSVNVPENKEQMKAALMSLASGSAKPTEEIDYASWHALHRYVTLECPLLGDQGPLVMNLGPS